MTGGTELSEGHEGMPLRPTMTERAEGHEDMFKGDTRVTSHQTDDVVKEYLAHVERLVSDLPLLQRRELLVDLETHIATARIEGGVQSEAEVLAILERLGSPEVVAAAAHEESPVAQFSAKAERPRRRLSTPLVIVLVVVGLLALFTACVGVSLVSRNGSSVPVPVPAPAVSSLN